MEQGRIIKLFPGGNTAYGFYSFYDQVTGPEARRIFILKGGPGVGKSTFLRTLGEQLVHHGYDVEFLCCSSDNGSLDGIIVPALGITLVDGTAPHIVDPRWPGAVDEIIHLGDYWDEAGLRSQREAIVKLGQSTAYLFACAYRYLAQAKLLQEESESYYTASEALSPSALRRTEEELAEAFFQGGISRNSGRVRHLFASAITPDGCVHHFATVFGIPGRRFIIRGGSKAARSRLVERVYREALNNGYRVDVFHCGLIPDYLEHLFLPDLSAAVITANEYHDFPPQPEDRLIDLDCLVESQALAPYQEDLSEARRRFAAALERAVALLGRAKKAHDEMEGHYIPNMDFGAINARRRQTLERILAYARNDGRDDG